MKDFITMAAFGISVFFMFVLFIFVISLPFAYMEGSAKAEYLLEAKGIEMHWYKASFLPDTALLDVKVRGTE